MKIAQIITELKPSGPANVVKNIVDHLPEGVECTVFYFRGPPTLEVGCHVRQIDFKSPGLLKAFDVVHSHGVRPDFLACYAAMRKRGPVFVSTLHNYIKEELLNIYGWKVAAVLTPVWLRVWRRMDALAVLTHNARHYYRNTLPEHRLHVVHNGIRPQVGADPLSVEDEAVLERLGRRYRILGSNAHLIKRKGLEEAVRALAELEDCALVVVGDGPWRERLIEIARAIGVEARCWFTGYRGNVSSFLTRYDIYVMPSHSEGFGLALLEAMAAGLPCVCSDIAVFHEILQQEEAVFFKVGDSAALAAAVRQALGQRELLSQRARERYLAQFTGEAMSSNYMAFYRHALREKGRTGAP